MVDLPAEHLPPTEHFRRSLNLSLLTFRRPLSIAAERLGGGQVSFEVAPSAVMAQLQTIHNVRRSILENNSTRTPTEVFHCFPRLPAFTSVRSTPARETSHSEAPPNV
ncbi:MAG: hypothetical protein ACTS41_01815 [Candidatus Hodgkinia cicadicola]